MVIVLRGAVCGGAADVVAGDVAGVVAGVGGGGGVAGVGGGGGVAGGGGGVRKGKRRIGLLNKHLKMELKNVIETN